MRTIALQSAVGGMALSSVGMIAAAAGYLPALEGAIAQEIIDLLAVLNAGRVALPTKTMSDFEAAGSFADSMRQACAASLVREVSVTCEIAAMLANASPRNPRLRTCSRSSSVAILLVA